MSILIKEMKMPKEGEYRMTLYVCDGGYAYMDVDSFPVDEDRFDAVPVSAIEDLPTIDPVKHGKWIKIVDCNTVQCSECFEDFDYIDGICYLCHGQELPNYCPNCGARMERSEE